MKTIDSFSKAIILGATGGIGRQLVKELARSLDHLVLVGRDSGKLSQVQEELTGSKAQLSIVTLDMLDQMALEAFVENLDADLLVNCAGVAYFSQGNHLATAKGTRTLAGELPCSSPANEIASAEKSENPASPTFLTGSSFSPSLFSSIQCQ